MAIQRLGIIMNGVTGRMGTNQHLIRSICAIRAQGGVALANGDRVMPDPILIGRNADKVAALAKAHGIERWSTDLNAALANPADTVFFQAVHRQRYDAIVCMYHDQGHGPMKLLAFDTGVNVTLGLPIIRTSVDHGTAFDIAWKGEAFTASLDHALAYAWRLARRA